MELSKIISPLPTNFRDEEQLLIEENIDRWDKLYSLTNEEINKLSLKKRSTSSNLYKLRGISKLVCELRLSQEDSSLLLHSGISSAESLSRHTPEELSRKMSRFTRQLKVGKKPIISLIEANELIKKAKAFLTQQH